MAYTSRKLNLIREDQFVFKKGHSIIHVLLLLTECINLGLNTNNKQPHCFLDFVDNWAHLKTYLGKRPHLLHTHHMQTTCGSYAGKNALYFITRYGEPLRNPQWETPAETVKRLKVIRVRLATKLWLRKSD
jgi:hypothetical protein